MSFISSNNLEKYITNAPIGYLIKVLEDEGYQVTKSNLQVTAISQAFLSSFSSTITIIDMGSYRECSDNEVAIGLLLRPRTGILANIVQKAEAMMNK